MVSFLGSKEGVIQGGHLAMITYGIGIITFIKNLKQEIPHVSQTCYSDNTGALVTFERLEKYFDLLTRQGPGRGYYPKLSKTV